MLLGSDIGKKFDSSKVDKMYDLLKQGLVSIIVGSV